VIMVWEDALGVLQREPRVVQRLFQDAYTHRALRDRDGRHLTADPRRVVVWEESMLVLRADGDRLAVDSMVPIPPSVAVSAGPLRSVEDVLEILRFSQYTVLAPERMRLRIGSLRYVGVFAPDYSVWRLELIETAPLARQAARHE
jgi:hypothetical protein